MSAIAFEAWPKIPRLNRGILVTEKLDGTNAAVVILPLGNVDRITREDGSVEFFDPDDRVILAVVDRGEGGLVVVLAQSRTRFVTPESDNYGFAAWVKANAETLVADLGVGRHFGEWYGAGIQRRYGLSEKRFALFNVDRWADGVTYEGRPFATPRLEVVPVLYRGVWNDGAIEDAVDGLRVYGSQAVPGFLRPEGVVVWHYASRTSFKVTVEGDAAPKGPEAHQHDEEVAA